MPTWYTPASGGDYDLLRSVIDEFHPDLVEADAKVGLVLAHPDPESGKPPLMKNRLQILAKIKPNPEADRVDGKPDATITLDAEHWAGLMDDGDAGRPKFHTRPHDWEVTGFRAVAERHKQHAAEVIEARRFHDKHGHLLFGFAEEHAVQGSLLDRAIVEAADRINAGELGPNITAEVHPGRRRRPTPAAVAAANR